MTQATLSQKTYDDLRRKLLAGELPPGARLVTRTLALAAGVSLAPIREAIHRLAVEGLVEHIPGAGAFVRKMSLQDLDELYVLREAIESCAAFEAAQSAGEADLRELELACRDASALVETLRSQDPPTASPEQFSRWIDLEERFHSTLIAISRNRLLQKVVSDFRALGRIFEAQRGKPELLTVPVAEAAVAAHLEMVAAVRRRDGERARDLMSAHIQNGRKGVLEHLRAHFPRPNGQRM